MRGDKSFENAAALLPRGIREAFLSLGAAEMEQAEEFRLRSGSRPAAGIQKQRAVGLLQNHRRRRVDFTTECHVADFFS